MNRDRDYPKKRKTQRRLQLESAPLQPTRETRRQKVRTELFGGKDTATKIAEADMKALRAYESEQVPDPFSRVYTNQVNATGPQNILPPPYNPYTLMRFPNENNTLRQCIDAMVINIESMGHRFEFVGDEGSEDEKEQQLELARLEALVAQPNGEYGLLELRERCRRDFETFGYSYIEICRGTFKRDIVSFYHAPAHTIRLTACDAEETEISVWLYRDGKYIQQKIKRRFRRYVQEIGTRRVYFKEFGDPRVISSKTGQVIGADDDANDAATELVFRNLYSPGSPYGMPRWINQLPSILGSRESELTNLQFFKDNAIPAMAVLISGGFLTNESVDEIEEHINSVQGRKSMHRVMVLEAQGSENAASTDGKIPVPKLEIKPLVQDRQSDALFQEYDDNNSKKVRSSFRLSPMLLGGSEDVTYAVAEASLVVAEGQVFGPERNKTDDIFNYVLLSDKDGKPPLHWRFRSNPPRIADPQTIVNALTIFDQIGAMTPNIAIGIANELFDLDIEIIDEEWGNFPFEATMSLLGRAKLKGMAALGSAVEAVEEATQPGKPGGNQPLNEKELAKVHEKIVEPLKQLVGANNVRTLRKKNKKLRR